MKLPDSWRVGATSGVQSTWMKEFPEYVAKAESVGDLWTLRNVLEARKNWMFPVTCEALSDLLERRAQDFGGQIAAVVSEIEPKEWHAQHNPFGRMFGVQAYGKRKRVDLTKRIIGEARDE